MIKALISGHVKSQIKDHLEPVKLGFSHVARDIQRIDAYSKESRELLEKWNKYFLGTLSSIEKSYKANDTSKGTVMEEIKQLHKAHTSLYTTLQNQQNSMQSVTTDMKTLHEGVSKAILTYNKHIVSLHGTVAELKSMIESTKKEQKERIMQPVVQKSEPKIEHVYQRPEKPPISNQEISTVRQIASSLTSSERQILLILVGTDQKLSYRDIAVNYGRSPSTIKNMIIKLKSKGIPLHESSGADGVKRYYVDDSFKKVLASKNF